jgi:predicted O-methyltransferase YrrM
LHTSDITAVAKLLTENGINPAENAELCSTLAGITSELRASLPGVNHAASQMQLRINVKENKSEHPTVKPQSLMRYLCRLITPPSGIILDPFFGSGSTGVAAITEGFSIIGIEQDAEFAEIARRRCEHARQSHAATLFEGL